MAIVETKRWGNRPDNEMTNRTKFFSLLTSLAVAGFCVTASETIAAEGFQDEPNYLMAYADPSNGNTRSSYPFGDFEIEEEHELNDAWLGLPVISNDGKTVGFVIDAEIDDTGMIRNLTVDLVHEGYPVFVEGSQAFLFDDSVAIDHSANVVAELERASDYVFTLR